MDKIITMIIFIGFLLFSCKTLNTKQKEHIATILFKNLYRESEKIEKCSISGLLKVTGFEKIPSGFISFESNCYFKSQKGNFKLSFLKKNIFEIIIQEKNIYLLNWTKKQYLILKRENIDFSNLIGINFNPVELSYFFIGKIPYSKDLVLLNFKNEKDRLKLELSNNISKYSIYLDYEDNIKESIIENQFFEPIYIEITKYTKNKEDIIVPQTINISNISKSIIMNFIINKVSLDEINFVDFNINDYSNWQEVKNIKELDVIIR